MVSIAEPQTSTSQRSGPIMATAVAATISTVLPGFLVGAISVQAIADFDISEARYGWGIGSFFLAAMAGSALLGKAAQKIGPRRLVVMALIVSAVASLCIALLATQFWIFLAFLAVTGLANSANQSAINLLLSQARIERLGLAIALKQSGMPAAALLGGLMVPLIAVTFDWRVAYGVASGMAVLAAVAVVLVLDRPGPITKATPPPLVTDRRTLLIATVGFACLAAVAGALTAWTVSSAVDAGIEPGPAGLLLSAAAGCGIGVRLLLGVRLDSLSRNPLQVAAVLSSVGAIGVLIVATRSPVAVVVGSLLAFATGWVWPVLTNFAIVRVNRAAAAAATGITQTGVYLGVFAGPLLAGVLIETAGYAVMWLCVAVVMLIGVAIVGRMSMGEPA